MAAYLFLGLIAVLPEYGLWPSLFDAVNHAMTGVATGGFSTLDDSIAGYGSAAVELLHVPPMVLGAIAFPVYYQVLRARDPRLFWQDPQFRSMIVLFGVLTAALVLLLGGIAEVATPLRDALFQVVSGVTTTGWQTSSVGDWEPSAVLLLGWGAMIATGSAGSTVGGLKLIRAYVLTRAVAWRIHKVLLPSDAVLPFRVGERTLGSDEMQREVADAATFSFLYLVILFAGTVITAHLVGPEFTVADAVFESISAQGNVGLSTGIAGPQMPVLIELLFIFQMWIGRLEIFPVIVLLRTLVSWTLRR